ncbi:hypothetical protein [Enhygromyxa salina]|uniref:Uncharacterized protein n=1 Tax=Enhygromyxa salina TaxID=215803 RepID=A0A2S9YUH5_9BACT|nr:hypothetical protein [Enhygromyxa salina]PRQ08746.1 hypothetical protein ENSA7_15640 [Enhygromyxa salina]
MDDELHEEGFVRGGVMQEVAFEYVRWYASVESDAEPVARSGPSTPTGPQRRRGSSQFEGDHALAARLINHLIDSEELEVVNHHAHTTLIEPVAACLAGSPAAAAARIALALEDADEVIDLYADDATIEAFLRARS